MAAQPSATFSRLLAPLQLKNGVTLINRAIMGSMHTGLEEGEGWGHKLTRNAAFFAERAKGHVGLMVTGGIAPNNAGRVAPMAAMMTTPGDAARHREITDAVHAVGTGSKIAMQILHSGRYGYHPFNVAPSAKKAPIGWFTPKQLSVGAIEQTVDDFVRCSCLAEEAGYDGVEIMGSEGYLINQFIAARTNFRDDEYGGSFDNRTRLARTIVEKVRAATRPDFIIMFRLSMLDLVQGGSDWPEVVALAQGIEAAGATIINTGIGWHEARIPTIATSVPRGGFSWVTHKLKPDVTVPLVATNRINTPEIAEEILSSGHSDLVSMARPFLADPFFLTKAMVGASHKINTCIACNQACLDHSFQARTASCLVNPRAAHETEVDWDRPTTSPMDLAVVGAGPAGLAFSAQAAKRGHTVTLYEATERIGGQFNLAKQIPGKAEFYETLRYFASELVDLKVDLKLNTPVDPETLLAHKHDAVILATGVQPRDLTIEGADHPKVVSYVDVLTRKKPVGRTVAIIGAGGIGFDVAEFLAHEADTKGIDTSIAAVTPPGLDHLLGGSDEATPRIVPDKASFLQEWGIDASNTERGGLAPGGGTAAAAADDDNHRTIYLFQRKKGKHGAGLGKTTGWIHRTSLKHLGVNFLGGLTYLKVDDEGLHVREGGGKGSGSKGGGVERVVPCDTIVVCAGQVSDARLAKPLEAAGMPTFVIGGAHVAAELDAKRAIDQACRLAAHIEDAAPDKVGEYVAPLGLNGWIFQKLTSRSTA